MTWKCDPGISIVNAAAKAQPSFLICWSAEHNESDPTGIRRLPRALKVLLRSFGLRCVSAIEEKLNRRNENQLQFAARAVAQAIAIAGWAEIRIGGQICRGDCWFF